VPKSKLDIMGMVRDLNFRVAANGIRKFLTNYVKIARHIIYVSAQAIGGPRVEGLLKPTSSVPTMVSARTSTFSMRMSSYRLAECFP
jgi:hypothetical protein